MRKGVMSIFPKMTFSALLRAGTLESTAKKTERINSDIPQVTLVQRNHKLCKLGAMARLQIATSQKQLRDITHFFLWAGSNAKKNVCGVAWCGNFRRSQFFMVRRH